MDDRKVAKLSRKTTAYARKIRRTSPGFNGAAWMNTMERCIALAWVNNDA